MIMEIISLFFVLLFVFVLFSYAYKLHELYKQIKSYRKMVERHRVLVDELESIHAEAVELLELYEKQKTKKKAPTKKKTK